MVEVSRPSGPPRRHLVSDVTPDFPVAAPTVAPARRAGPWRARLLAVCEVLLCCSLPTQVLAQYAAVGAGVEPWMAPGVPTLGFLATTQLADAALLIGLMAWISRLHQDDLRELWLGSRPWLRECRLGLLLVPVVFLLVAGAIGVLSVFAPGLHNVDQNPFEPLLNTPLRSGIMVLVVIIAGGVREELQRAFLLRRFERHLGGSGIGVVVLSLAFGAGHYIQGWDAAVATGLAGAFWAVVYLRRRSVVAPLVSHAAFDVLEVLRAATGVLTP